MCKPAGALVLKRYFNKNNFPYARSIKEQILVSEVLQIEKKEAFQSPSSSLTNIHCIRIKTKVKGNFSQMRLFVTDIRNKS
jgi:hypothetical protein